MPEDGRAAVTELSKYVQTCIFNSPVVDALGAVAAKLQFLIASTKWLHSGFQTGKHHHARQALKAPVKYPTDFLEPSPAGALKSSPSALPLPSLHQCWRRQPVL